MLISSLGCPVVIHARQVVMIQLGWVQVVCDWNGSCVQKQLCVKLNVALSKLALYSFPQTLQV